MEELRRQVNSYQVLREAYKRFQKGERLFVEINSGARKGSIAYIKDASNIHKDMFFAADLAFDDRDNIVNLPVHKFNLLEDYNGPTKWVYTRQKSEKAKKKIPLDMIGREIKVGDLILYKAKQGPHRSTNFFGKVTRTTDNGTVFVKRMLIRGIKDLKIFDKNNEDRVFSNDDALIINDDLRRDIMLRRLTVTD